MTATDSENRIAMDKKMTNPKTVKADKKEGGMRLFAKPKVRQTIKEVSVLIYYQNQDGEILTEERKISFNDTLQIDIKPDMKVVRIHISSFEVLITPRKEN
jgi:hypothetical protein